MKRKINAGRCVVVLVHYNNPLDTLNCLKALSRLRSAPAGIVVVDNGSTETNIRLLRAGWTDMAAGLGRPTPETRDASRVPDLLPPCLFLTLGENRGFAGGNNAALRLLLACPDGSRCSAFWLLNNDTEPHPDALDALCARLDQGADICGSTLLYADKPDIVQAAGGSTLSTWTGATSFLLKNTPLKDVLQADIASEERRMSFVVGASALVRREVFEKIGLLPEEYFLYYEDAALGLIARKAGYSLAWARGSLVLHKEGGSTGASGGTTHKTAPQRSRLVDYFSIRNRYYLLRRYYPWHLPLSLLFLGGVFLKRLHRGQADRIPLLLKAAWHGVSSCMGKTDGLWE